jgi:methyl-accepting chemotaxis protein
MRLVPFGCLPRADENSSRYGADLKRGNDERIRSTEAEAAALSKTTQANLIIALIVSVVATGGAVLMAHSVVKTSIVNPVLELNGQMAVLAKGDHAITIAHTRREDEIGMMSRSVAVFRDQSEERASLEAEKQRGQAEQEKVVSTVGRHLEA